MNMEIKLKRKKKTWKSVEMNEKEKQKVEQIKEKKKNVKPNKHMRKE